MGAVLCSILNFPIIKYQLRQWQISNNVQQLTNVIPRDSVDGESGVGLEQTLTWQQRKLARRNPRAYDRISLGRKYVSVVNSTIVGFKNFIKVMPSQDGAAIWLLPTIRRLYWK